MKSEEVAEISRSIMRFFRNSEAVNLNWWVFLVRLLQYYLDFA